MAQDAGCPLQCALPAVALSGPHALAVATTGARRVVAEAEIQIAKRVLRVIVA